MEEGGGGEKEEAQGDVSLLRWGLGDPAFGSEEDEEGEEAEGFGAAPGE